MFEIVTGEENYWQGKSACADYYSTCRPPYQEVAVPWAVNFYRSRREFVEEVDDEDEATKIPLALDLGCGTGQVSAELSPYCERVLGVDLSEDMLKVARRDRPRPNVEYRRGSVLDLSALCGDHEADLVVVSESIHMFHTARFYAEAKRVLKPDGVLAIVGYTIRGFRYKDDQRLTSAYTDFLKRQLRDEKWEEMMALVYSNYKTLESPFPADVYREGELEVEVTKETVFGAAMALDWYKDGRQGVEKFVDSLPDAWPLTMITDVYGLFILMAPE